MIDRAAAALLGLFVGEAFGNQTEGMMEVDLLQQYPEGLQEIFSAEETIETCGMSGEASDLSVLLAMSILSNKKLDTDHAKASYRKWVKEKGDAANPSLKQAIEYPSSAESSECLNRCVPIALLAVNSSEKEALNLAKRECSITHDSLLCQHACQLVVSALAYILHEEYAKDKLVRFMQMTIQKQSFDERLSQMLQLAGKSGVPSCDGPNKQSVLLCLQVVLHTVLHAESFEEGIKTLAMKGGSAQTNLALFGAFWGALEGLESIEEHWVDEIYPSAELDTLIKKQTLFKRQTIKMENLADQLAEGLLSL